MYLDGVTVRPAVVSSLQVPRELFVIVEGICGYPLLCRSRNRGRFPVAVQGLRSPTGTLGGGAQVRLELPVEGENRLYVIFT